MAEATQTSQELEQQLNKTDFGHLIYEYRKLLFAFLLAILVGVTAYLLWKQSQEAAAVETAEEVFKFQSSTWAEAKTGKISAEDLAQKFSGLSQDIQQAPVMLPIVLEMGEYLYNKGSFNEANQILSKVSDSSHVMSQFFVSMQRVVVLEKLGKVDEAIALLEKLNGNKDVPMPQKVSLELGRLYKEKGEKGKAQTQFENIISKYPNDEYAKVAKLYLNQLAK